eukprot:CAMPEP_0179208962 /NCGR_PEP_ID=MMETSP0796-20121207/104213_1 /TAXON_ID=73915 /ORGANISM="Pyrodinium bahamense, Strain pbaha01" /LENGTH=189 /DNA_ID=CAMNT_0020913915 /DNA_START=221 /DNA_END=790 /DNA_ORIENTATION=-
MGEAMDGCIMGPETTWATQSDFVTWLSEQSDSTLHGDGNQRVTRARLLGWLPDAVVARLAASDALVADWREAAQEKAQAEKAAEEKVEAEKAAAKLAAENQKQAAIAAAAAKKAEEVADALAVDSDQLERMNRAEVVALIRLVAPADSALVHSNLRVLMSPNSTKEEVVALWQQVRAAAAESTAYKVQL